MIHEPRTAQQPHCATAALRDSRAPQPNRIIIHAGCWPGDASHSEALGTPSTRRHTTKSALLGLHNTTTQRPRARVRTHHGSRGVAEKPALDERPVCRYGTLRQPRAQRTKITHVTSWTQNRTIKLVRRYRIPSRPRALLLLNLDDLRASNGSGITAANWPLHAPPGTHDPAAFRETKTDSGCTTHRPRRTAGDVPPVHGRWRGPPVGGVCLRIEPLFLRHAVRYQVSRRLRDY